MSVVNGCTVFDAIKIGLVIAVQWTAGSIIWSRIIKPGVTTTIESVAIGAPIGFALSTLLDQTFINTPARLIAWALPAIFILLDLILRNPKQDLSQIEPECKRALVWAFAVTLIGLSGFYFVYLVGLIPILFYLFVPHANQNRQFRSKHILAVISLSAICTYLMITVNRPSPNSLLRPIYYDTNDHIFGEQLSTSIAHWGLGENSAAIGTTIKYHWLSLGWSGMVTRISGAGPWIVNLHVIPILVFLILSFMAIAITRRINQKNWIIALSPLLLFAADDPSTTLRFYFNGATSNLLPHIWLAATVYLLLQNPLNRSFRFRAILILLSTATILGKGPFGVVLAGGYLCLILFGLIFWKRKIWRPIVLTSMYSVASMTIAYFLFIEDESNVTYSLQLGQIKALFPFPVLTYRPIGSQFSFYIGVVFFVTFLLRRFWILTIPLKRNLDTSIQSVFLAGCGLTGLLSFFLYNLGGTQYFLNASLTACTFGGIFYLAQLLEDSDIHLSITRNNFGLFLLGGVSWITILLISHLIDSKTLQYFTPLLVLFSTSILIWMRSKDTTPGFSPLIQKMTIPGLVIFSIANFLTFVQRIDFKLTQIDPQIIEQTASEGELTALNWISHNSKQDVIVATNRSLCEDGLLCEHESSSHLVSAVSRRRVLLEGPYFVPSSRALNGGYEDWASLRARLSIGFVESPSKLLADQLTEYGVTLIYVQKSSSDMKSWEPWATTVYENPSAAVLMLNS
jgi:hypothetical protein